MKILYAGDIHGSVAAAIQLDNIAFMHDIRIIVQCGDFAMHWNGYEVRERDSLWRYFEQRESPAFWYTCGGNHENWTDWLQLAESEPSPYVRLAQRCYYIKRGSHVNIGGIRHTFLGGAESTDRQWRTPYISWWPEETPSYKEFVSFSDSLNTHKPQVVVTHDAPLRVALDREDREKSTTPRTLEQIVATSEHKPRYWMLGHHHELSETTIEDTTYFCTGVNGQYIILDFPTQEIE